MIPKCTQHILVNITTLLQFHMLDFVQFQFCFVFLRQMLDEFEAKILNLNFNINI